MAAQRGTRGGNVRDPVSRDPKAKGGGFSNAGSLFVLGIGALFGAYVFNIADVKTTLDNFFGGIDDSLKAHNGDVVDLVNDAIPIAKIVLLVLGAWILLSLMRRWFRAGRKEATLASRKPLTVEEFIEIAAEHNISAKVAREAYHLLAPHYSHRMRTRLSDSLEDDLQLSKPERFDLVGNLLRRTDRLAHTNARERDVETVLDLLLDVESATPRFLSHSHRQPGMVS
jgi:hypothetical protein